MMPRTGENELEIILERVRQFQKQEDKVFFLTQSIYRAIPEMFEKRLFDPAGIEIHYEHGEPQSMNEETRTKKIKQRIADIEKDPSRGKSEEDLKEYLRKRGVDMV